MTGDVTIEIPTARASAYAPVPTVTVTLPSKRKGASALTRLVLAGLVVRLAGDAIEAGARHLLGLLRRLCQEPAAIQ
jgi:hypothetical protein